MEAFAVLAAKAPRGRAAAAAAAAATPTAAAGAAEAATAAPAVASHGGLPYRQHIMPVLDRRGLLDSAGARQQQQQQQQQQDLEYQSAGAASAPKDGNYPNVRDQLGRRQQQLMQLQQQQLLLIVRPLIAANAGAAREIVSLLLLPLAETDGSAALFALQCLTELLCPLSPVAAARVRQQQLSQQQQQQQQQRDEGDEQQQQDQHALVSSCSRNSSSSSGVLQSRAMVRRVSTALFSLLSGRRSRIASRRSSLSRLRQRLAAVAAVAGHTDVNAAITAAAAAAAAAAVAGTPAGVAAAQARCAAGGVPPRDKKRGAQDEVEGDSDFAVAALEYEGQAFWLQLLQREERLLETAAVECLQRLAALNFEAVLDPLTCYSPQPAAAAIAASAHKDKASSSSPSAEGEGDRKERHVSNGDSRQGGASSPHAARGPCAGLLDLQFDEETAAAAAVRWRGDCCFSSSCIHRAFAACVARDRALSARYISHATNVCNNLAASAEQETSESALFADVAVAAADAEAETAAVAAHKQEALVEAAAPAQHQATLLLLLLLQHEQQQQLRQQRPSSLGRMLQRHSAPLLGTALLRLGTAHAAARSKQQQQQLQQRFGRKLLILGPDDELGSAAALHVVNLTPSAYLTVADVSGDRFILPAQQQEQQHQQRQQQQRHSCNAWASLLPGGFLASLTTDAAAAAAATAATAAATTATAGEEENASSKKQERQPPAQRMQRLLAIATDAALDAAAMTLENLQPQVDLMECLSTPAAAAAAAATAAENWLAADALHSLRAALGCLQALTHLWVGLHRAAAEAAGEPSPAAAATTNPAAAAAAGGGKVAAFGDERRALRLLEVLEVGFAVYPVLRCLPTYGQKQGEDLVDRRGEKATAAAAAATAAAAAAFAATLQCVVHCTALPSCAWPSAAAKAAALCLLKRRLLRPCCFLPLAALSEDEVLPLLFRALRRSAMLLQQVHAEAESAAANAATAAAATAAAAAKTENMDSHFLGPREGDELVLAALFYSAAANPPTAQAAAECLLSLLSLLGLPRTSQQQQQQQQQLLYRLTKALTRELKRQGLLRPVCLLRGDEQQSLPCACCCVLQQQQHEQQQQEQQQQQEGGLHRPPQETTMLLEAAGSFFYNRGDSVGWSGRDKAAAAAAAAPAAAGGTGVSLVGRSELVQRLLQPLLQCLLLGEWQADIERDCCLCDVDRTDPFASELEAVGAAAAANNSSSNSSSSSSTSSIKPATKGDLKGSLPRSKPRSSNSSSSSTTTTASSSNASSNACSSMSSRSQILDAHSLMMRECGYRASRRLCLRVCHLLQCCRFFFPSRCYSVSAPPHPAVILHKQEAAGRRRQRRVDWLFFGSLTGGDDEETDDADGGEGGPDAAAAAGAGAAAGAAAARRSRLLGKAPIPADLPGMTAESALKESDIRETAAVQKWQHMQFFLSRRPGLDLPAAARPINPQKQQPQQQHLFSAFAPSKPQAEAAATQSSPTDLPLLAVCFSPADAEDEWLLQLQQALRCFNSSSSNSSKHLVLRSCSDVAVDGCFLLVICRQLCGLMTMRPALPAAAKAPAAGKGASSTRGAADAAAAAAAASKTRSSSLAAAAVRRRWEEERAVTAVALMYLRRLKGMPPRKEQQQRQQEEQKGGKEAATGGGELSLTAAPTAIPSPQKATEATDEAEEAPAVSI
ncbi:hypothetical protein ACSSS7_000558 [Eimeria intestinalis]